MTEKIIAFSSTFNDSEIEIFIKDENIYINIEHIFNPLGFNKHRLNGLLLKKYKSFIKYEGKIVNLVSYPGLLHLAYLSSNISFREWCLGDLLEIVKNTNNLISLNSNSEFKHNSSFSNNRNNTDNNSDNFRLNSSFNPSFNPIINSNPLSALDLTQTSLRNSVVNLENFTPSSQTSTSTEIKVETDLKDLYNNNSCLLLKDNTYHDFLQRLVMKVLNQIPYIHWEEEISIDNTYNPKEAKTRRFDLVEHQPSNRVIIWEIHTKPIDKDKVIKTVIDKAYLRLGREHFKKKEVSLCFTSPEGITESGILAIEELKDVRFVPYQDLLTHAFKMFRLLTPKASQWRLKEEEAQINEIIKDRVSSNIGGNTYKGVIKDKKKYRATVFHQGKRYQVGNFTCPLEAAIAYDNKIREMKIDKPLNFPHLETTI